MVKIWHITGHKGTKRNFENVKQLLNSNIELNTYDYTHEYYIGKQDADEKWINLLQKTHAYDILLFTDTSMNARPFLQNIEKHSCRIIIYITNRFDWGIFGNIDTHYYELYKNASIQYKNRVIFCADNHYDMYYAQLNGIQFYYKEPIKLIPTLNFSCIPLVIPHNFFIHDRGTSASHLSGILNLHNIPHTIYGEKYKQYDNEIELVLNYKATIHLPYQTNIQSLYEKLGYGIIFLIPSKPFIEELVKESWYKWEEKNKSSELLNKSIELSEWYKSENAELFIYFESWENLFEKTQMYPEELHNQKKIIEIFMKKNNKQQLEKWREIL